MQYKFRETYLPSHTFGSESNQTKCTLGRCEQLLYLYSCVSYYMKQKLDCFCTARLIHNFVKFQFKQDKTAARTPENNAREPCYPQTPDDEGSPLQPQEMGLTVAGKHYLTLRLDDFCTSFLCRCTSVKKNTRVI